MKQALLVPILTRIGTSTTTPCIKRVHSRHFLVYVLLALTLTLLLLMSNTAMASHFKGGHFTYKYLGEGRYEVLIKGYWDKDDVGNIFPRYEGSPKIHGFPLTVSKTLLPDGETVEHIQKQQITWAKPGLYKIYWTTCCRVVGSNFNNNANGISAMVNYDPAAPSSSVQFYDTSILNFESGKSINYTINTMDPDGHELEYQLEVPYGLPKDAYEELLATGFRVTADGSIFWENPQEGIWLVKIKILEKIDGNYTGAFIDREYIINVVSSAENTSPLIIIDELTGLFTLNKIVEAGETIMFDIKAKDATGQSVILLANGFPFEKGAKFTQTEFGSVAKGTFSWATTETYVGTYKVQFAATDNYSSRLSSYINVVISAVTCDDYTTQYTIVVQPCPGSSNGEITLSASKGVSPFMYSLDNGTTYQSLPDFEGLAAGSYTGVIKDAIGCTSQPTTIALEEAPVPSVSLDLPSGICANSYPLELTGGSPSGGNYHGPGIENGIFYPSKAGVGLHTIYYNYTDNNGCTYTTSKEITVNVPPIADAGADTTVIPGPGARSCTMLTASASSGTAPYAYYWSTGETTQSIKVCPTEATTYILTVTDASGCSDTSQVIVNVKETGQASNSGNKPAEPGKEFGQSHKGANKPANGARASLSSNEMALDSEPELVAITEGVVVFPNPLTSSSKLKVALNEADVITIDIIDMSGKIVKKLYTGAIEARQELSFDVDNKLGNKSFYFVRVTTTKKIYTIKLFMN